MNAVQQRCIVHPCTDRPTNLCILYTGSASRCVSPFVHARHHTIQFHVSSFLAVASERSANSPVARGNRAGNRAGLKLHCVCFPSDLLYFHLPHLPLSAIVAYGTLYCLRAPHAVRHLIPCLCSLHQSAICKTSWLGMRLQSRALRDPAAPSRARHPGQREPCRG